MLSEMSARELLEWRAYSIIEPFGETRADLRAGIISAQIWNANPYRGKDSEPVKASDFLPVFDADPRQEAPTMSDEMIAAQAAMINAAFGGRDVRMLPPEYPPDDDDDDDAYEIIMEPED